MIKYLVQTSKYKMLVSDVDGTLTPSGPNSVPSERVIDTIKQAVNKGLIFCLATARPFSMVEYLIKHLGNVGLCIVDNGAVIVDSKDGSVIWQALLPPDRAREIFKLIRRFDNVWVSTEMGSLDNPKEIPSKAEVRKVSVHDIPIVEAEDLIKNINQLFKDVTSVRANSYKGKEFLDVYFSDIKANKQQAVFNLSELLGIKYEEIIGVGDGYNDYPLLMACGFKVAMGNAVKELKDVADYIAPSVDQDGLAEVIERYI